VLNSLGSNSNSTLDQVHVPYRNSKLTYLLASALGADKSQICRTMVVLNVSPCTQSYENEGESTKSDQINHDKKTVSESVNSIMFGLRAKDVKLPSSASGGGAGGVGGGGATVMVKNLNEKIKQQVRPCGRKCDHATRRGD